MKRRRAKLYQPKLLIAACSALLVAARCSGALLQIEGSSNYGATLPNAPVTHTLTVRNLGSADATLTNISNAGLNLQASSGFSLTGGTCATGQVLRAESGACTLEISFSPPFEEAQFFADVTVQARWVDNYDGSRQSSNEHFAVQGYGGPKLRFQDGPIYDFGTRPLGSTVSQLFFLINRHSVDVTLGDVSAAALGLAPPFFLRGGSCTSGQIVGANFEACTLTIGYNPTSAGSVSHTINLPYTWFDGTLQSGVALLELRGATSAPLPVLQVVTGTLHSCALLEGGKVRCWGSNRNGQLGYPGLTSVGTINLPSSVGFVDVGGKVVQLAAGGDQTCALLDTGNVRCWGFALALGYPNHSGNVGDDETPASVGDVDIGGKVAQVSTNFLAMTCAVLTTGKVRCWGSVPFGGTLGYPTTETIGDDETPASMGDIDLGGDAVQVSAGGTHACALMTTGAVRCWGDGTYGQLGYGNTERIGDDESPASAGDVNVGGPVAQIAAGQAHTCARLTSGKVRCWGSAQSGELGYGNTLTVGDDETPASAGDVNVGGQVVDITAGTTHTCAVLSGGAVRCWGQGQNGALGYGNTQSIGDDEAPASAGNVSVGATLKQVSAGLGHTCAVLTTGNVRCWGLGSDGQLGYGNTSTIGDNETPASAGDISVQ